MTILRLAYGGPGIWAGGDTKPTPSHRMPPALEHALKPRESRYDPPALLVSFWYWRSFEQERPRYLFRDYALDSGAFSAHHSGAKIDLTEYIEFCQERLATDDQCAEVFALDVLDDWRGTIRNTEKMWEAGVPAIPAYHCGEPEDVLTHLAATYPKIALGGAVGMRNAQKIAWSKACFSRVWPKPIHGFGFGAETQIMALPFHSVDATNWEAGPARFGSWKSMPGANYRGSSHPLRVEVDWYLRLEQRARARWRREMKTLNALLEQAAADSPAVRLAVSGTDHGPRHNDNRAEAFGDPAVRLVPTGHAGRTAAKREAFGDPTLRLATARTPKSGSSRRARHAFAPPPQEDPS